VRVNDTSNRIDYSGQWKVQKNSPTCLYKNDFHWAEPNANNTALMNFDGTRVKVWFVKSPTMGNAQMVVDGVVVKTVGLKASITACKSWTSDLLPYGNHTIEVRPKGTGGRISLDVITIYP
jgi:hypothetical protein